MQHHNTYSFCEGIAWQLKLIMGLRDMATRDLEQVNKLDPGMYAEGYIEKKRNAIFENFKGACYEHTVEMEKHASSIIEAEAEEMAKPLDVNDTSLNNAVAMIRNLGDALTPTQQKEIAEQFKGNYAAEECLKALYEKLGLYHVIQKTDGEALTRELYRAVIAFNNDTEKGVASFRAVENAINNMYKAFNIDKQVDLGISEENFLNNVMAGAGLL